jgi:hypothetical protein
VRGRLHVTEYVGMVGGAMLAIGVFLPWYGTDASNRFAQIDGRRGDLSCWEVHPILRWLMLLAAIAPFVLAYIIAADKPLSWVRGEMTAVTSIAALGLLFYVGAIDRPGDPGSAIKLKAGWFVSVAGALLMFWGAARRASSHERPRKPPGTI